MPTFPDTIIPDNESYKVAQAYKTLTLGLTDGDYRQRRRKRTTPLHTITMYFKPLLDTEIQTLWEFHQARNGSWEAFVFFDFKIFPYTGIAVGTGTGGALTCNLKAKEVNSLTVYVGGVAKVKDTDYTFVSDGSGTNGQDKIVFLAGHYPANGAAVTASYRGRKYFPAVIFKDDVLSRDAFVALLYQLGLTLVEVPA